MKATQLAIREEWSKKTIKTFNDLVSREESELFKALVKKTKHYIVDRDRKNFVNIVVSTSVSATPAHGYLQLLSFVEDTYDQLGIETINLDRKFREKYQETNTLPSWETDTHWNATGHQWVATEIYNYVLRNIDQ